MKRALLLAGGAALSLSCQTMGVPLDDGLRMSRGPLAIHVRDDGTFDISKAGRIVLERVGAEVLYEDAGVRKTASVSGCRIEPRAPVVDLACMSDGLAMDVHLELDDVVRARLTVTADRELTLLRLTPISARALHLGPSAARHRILENGRMMILDQSARLENGDASPVALAATLPIPLRGASISNWSHAVVDLDGGGALVAGALSTDHGIPVFAVESAEDGASFSTYAADTILGFDGKRVRAGERVSSELVYVDPLPDDPREALERYASALAQAQHIRTKRVPSGWNSWSGGESTGGHGQTIDQALVRASLDVFDRELRPFGATDFPIDDGWQTAKGDWEWRADRFPSGGAALAGEIASRGLVPGLWIAPFWAEPTSMLARAHPEQMIGAPSGLLGVAGKPNETLDPARPDVVEEVRAMGGRIARDGFRWVKIDFTYQALLGRPSDPRSTTVEAWRAGVSAMREALGPDTFVLGIGAVGLNVGVVDSVRLTLDNAPRWDSPSEGGLFGPDRSIKETVRTASRRWFYGNRAFVPHPDSIFFRSMKDSPPLAFEEARAFATFVAMTGGTVEVGDRLVDLASRGDAIAVLRRLLPAQPITARPLDVFEHDIPETFVAHVSPGVDVAGVFHWGTNGAMPDAARSHRIACSKRCVVFESWTGAYLGERQGPQGFEVDVPPHDARVFVLRDVEERPQLLGTNRHLLPIEPEAWDPASHTLSVQLLSAVTTTAAPFEHRVHVRVAPGFRLRRVLVDAAPVDPTVEGEIVTLRVAPNGRARAAIFEFDR